MTSILTLLTLVAVMVAVNGEKRAAVIAVLLLIITFISMRKR